MLLWAQKVEFVDSFDPKVDYKGPLLSGDPSEEKGEGPDYDDQNRLDLNQRDGLPQELGPNQVSPDLDNTFNP